MRRYEEQTLQQKEMNREVTDMRRQLGHTRTGKYAYFTCLNWDSVTSTGC